MVISFSSPLLRTQRGARMISLESLGRVGQAFSRTPHGQFGLSISREIGC